MVSIYSYYEKEKWNEKQRLTKNNDIHFSSEYLKMNENIQKGVCECFVYEDSNSLVLYPYIKRQIKNTDFYDIISPYGYGGYIYSGKSSIINKFQESFIGYCKDTNIVSEFIRFHPFFDNHKNVEGFGIRVKYLHPIVVFDFMNDSFNFKSDMSKSVKELARRAQNKGVTFLIDTELRFIDEFQQLYKKTMVQKNAADFYFFDKDFFNSLKDNMKEQTSMLLALLNDQIIAGLVVLHDNKCAYAFLGCSDYDFLNFKPNDFLYYNSVKWASETGVDLYTIGGGMKGEDSLFKYKSKFSSQRREFFVGERIHKPEIYLQLCNEKMENDKIDKTELHSRQWFPLYRS